MRVVRSVWCLRRIDWVELRAWTTCERVEDVRWKAGVSADWLQQTLTETTSAEPSSVALPLAAADIIETWRASLSLTGPLQVPGPVLNAVQGNGAVCKSADVWPHGTGTIELISAGRVLCDDALAAGVPLVGTLPPCDVMALMVEVEAVEMCIATMEGCVSTVELELRSALIEASVMTIWTSVSWIMADASCRISSCCVMLTCHSNTTVQLKSMFIVTRDIEIEMQ
jgi:hypothetical protein